MEIENTLLVKSSEDGEILSSITLYEIEAVIDGIKLPARGIGHVGTKGQERKKGYASSLIREALAIDDKPVLLFTRIQKTGFFERLGFVIIPRDRLKLGSRCRPLESTECMMIHARKGVKVEYNEERF